LADFERCLLENKKSIFHSDSKLSADKISFVIAPETISLDPCTSSKKIRFVKVDFSKNAIFKNSNS
jgi:hypothetical protein